jgi:hypothetical protein
MRYYFPELDLLKGLAIISVLIMHMIPYRQLLTIWGPLIFTQAIPIFLIIMGFTNYLWFFKRQSFSTSLITTYFRNKILRYGIPIGIVFIGSLAFVMAIGKFHFTPYMIIGELPISGLGNYFISLILQNIIIAPIIYYFMVKKPLSTLSACFSLSLLFEVVSPNLPLFLWSGYFYQAFIGRWLFYIALGSLIAHIYFKESNKLNKCTNFIKFGGIFSLAIIGIMYFYEITSCIIPENYTPNISSCIPYFQFVFNYKFENVFTAFYPALIVYGLIFYPALIKKFAENLPRLIARLISIVNIFIQKLGIISLHIFLVQILYFGTGMTGILQYILNKYLQVDNSPLLFILNFSIIFLISFVFYYANQIVNSLIGTKRVSN